MRLTPERLPAGSCDAHCHIFGPSAVFPFAPESPFEPPEAPKEDLLALHGGLGLDRAVLVQSTGHGLDHASLLDALAAAPDRLRGVALLDSGSTVDLDELDRAGVRGIRLNFMPHLGRPPSTEMIQDAVRRTADRGWHLEVHVAGDGILRWAPLLARLPVTVVLDHMARLDLATATAGEEQLIRLLDLGHVWVKVSGIDRLTPGGLAPYDAGVALAARLVAAAPERVVWGSDWPHVNITGPHPDDHVLASRLSDIAPGPAALRRLLVTNPETLFGFARAPVSQEAR